MSPPGYVGVCASIFVPRLGHFFEQLLGVGILHCLMAEKGTIGSNGGQLSKYHAGKRNLGCG